MGQVLKFAMVFSCFMLILAATGCTTEDTTPPSAPTGIVRTSPGNDTTPSFEWNAAKDDGSGVAGYLAKIDNGDWLEVGNAKTCTFGTAVTDGSHEFQVRAIDKAGNLGGIGSLTFICDTVAPIITNVSASSTSTTSFTITWTTDENSTSQVQYGQTTSYGYFSTLNSSFVTSHSVTVTGLALYTTYHYRVWSIDACGNEVRSGDYLLSSCSIIGPIVSNVAVSEITQTSARITWTTDDPSTSQVEYGTTSDLGTSSPINTTLVTSHSVVLTGLIQGTYYYYQVKSKDACDNEGTSFVWDNFATPAVQNLAVGQTSQSATQRVTVKSAVRTDHYVWEGSSGYSYTEYAASGKIFIIVDAEVENIGTESFYSYAGDFSVSDASSYKYEYEIYLADDDFNSVELYTGQKTGGKILFEVPIAATGLKVAYDLGGWMGQILTTWVL